MKFLLRYFFFFVLLNGLSSGQWIQQNPLPPRGSLNNVHFSDLNNGIIVGEDGIILRTTNSGEEWVSQESSTMVDLYASELISVSTGIVAGDEGTILRTADGGNNWTQVESGTIYNLRDVCFADNNKGWVVGGKWSEDNIILKTNDAGINWIPQTCPTTKLLYGVSFINADNGIAVGDSGIILKTTNGGEDWNEVESGTILPLRDICFTDEQNGWAVGGYNYIDGHVILMTKDGGNTWNIQPDTIPQLYSFYGVNFSDPYNGFIVGGVDNEIWPDTYIINKTTDGGLTWTKQKSGSGEKFMRISFSDFQNGSVIGSGGTILRTIDGGESWRTQGGTKKDLKDVCFTDLNNGIVVGDGGTVLNTSDGGENWNELMFDTPYYFKKVCFINQNIGWLIGKENFLEFVILKTTNGGTAWIKQYSCENILLDIFFLDKNTGVVATAYDTILRTTDGGNTWIKQTCVTHPINGIYFSNANTGTAVSNDGIILRTTDGGENWTPQLSGLTNDLKAVYFTSIDNGTIVGSNVIIKTSDGGIHWNRISSFSYDFSDITFSDPENGTIIGYSGIILRTTDGGENWMLQSSCVQNSLYGVSFTDGMNGTVVGQSGIILRTTNGGSTFIQEERGNGVPREFKLSQNYPNLFNPTTRIMYSIPNKSNITLKIFDIIGNDIETLVNGCKQAGTYEITWYAGNLPSGVYICRLQAGKYISSTKMLLLK